MSILEKVALVALAGGLIYFVVGYLLASYIALGWNPQKGPYDAAPYILLWPVTLILAFTDAVRDSFQSTCESLHKRAMKETPRPLRRSLMSRVRLR